MWLVAAAAATCAVAASTPAQGDAETPAVHGTPPPPPPPPAAQQRVGWFDCTGSSPDAHSIKRAWRRAAAQAHPDRHGASGGQGSGDAVADFDELTRLRDVLQEPDRFQLYKALNNLTNLRPFTDRDPSDRDPPPGAPESGSGSASHAHGDAGAGAGAGASAAAAVVGVSFAVAKRCADVLDTSTCAPYATLSARISASMPGGSSWTLSLVGQTRRWPVLCCAPRLAPAPPQPPSRLAMPWAACAHRECRADAAG